MLEPLDFLARLAALVPTPRVNLVRFHGVFAPNSRHRARVTPAGRGPGARHSPIAPLPEPAETSGQSPPSGWARRLARVFGIDVRTCNDCGGQLRVIACIEDRLTIDSILAHLESRRSLPGPTDHATRCRAPPSPLGRARRDVGAGLAAVRVLRPERLCRRLIDCRIAVIDCRLAAGLNVVDGFP